MPRDISNNEDVLDSRDIIARIEELEAERDGFVMGCPAYVDGTHGPGEECPTCNGNGDRNATPEEWAQNCPDDAAELAILSKLAEEAEGYADDWKYGETLIRDSYFRTYAEELAEDIGAINHEASWPNNCIDWDRACRELQMDYTSVDFDGVTYWVL